MTDVPYPTDYDRMRDNIRDELAAQKAMADLPLDDVTLDRMADGIATNLDYAFSVAWAPRWVKEGNPHRWVEGPQHFVECLRCQRITAHQSGDEADAWWEAHVRAEHA